MSASSGRSRRPQSTDRLSRVYGLGTIFAKSLRDSRRATLLAGIGVGLIVLATATQVASEFGTAEARATMATLPEQLPAILRGLLGEPINLGTLGGFLSWRTLNFVPIMLGVWSIVALSGTIATEARSGSMDLVASSPDLPRGDRDPEGRCPPGLDDDRVPDRRPAHVAGHDCVRDASR